MATAFLLGLLHLFVAHAHIITMRNPSRLVRLPESVWRASAAHHKASVRQLLDPGLLSSSSSSTSAQEHHVAKDGWTALDPQHPVFNFLIEYYGLKGLKGPRRLARWSPDPQCLVRHRDDDYDNDDADGILLEGASEDDFESTLHMRGAMMHEDGIVYSPSSFFGRGEANRKEEATRAASAYLWYHDVISQTLQAEPVLYCHGLHEFAMQYQPEGAPPPPSAKYQSHLPLRVSRQTINQAVERKGVHCTHLDALKYFAEAANPLNHYGSYSTLSRKHQLRLEQPACVHAQMDLIKMSLRLQPFVGADLVRECLQVALAARRLDVAASPYDATAYGLSPVPVETPQGRADYRQIQTNHMRQAEPVRQRLLDAYRTFLHLAFDQDTLRMASSSRMGATRVQNQSPQNVSQTA